MSDPLSRMSNRELRALLLDLREHSMMRLRRRSRSIDLADDFVQMAILRAKSTRKYDPNKGTYLSFLKGAIDSIIYHHYHNVGHVEIAIGEDNAFYNFVDGKFTPEDELIYFQLERNMLEYINSRSGNCYTIAIWMLKGGISSPAEIGELIDVETKVVYSRIKHLRSIVKKWIEISNKPAGATVVLNIKGRE